MTKKLLLSEVRERIDLMLRDFKTDPDIEKFHTELNKLQREVFLTIASAPAGADVKALKDMASLVLPLLGDLGQVVADGNEVG